MHERKAFVFADVHGFYKRMEALLLQEGIIDEDGQRIDNETLIICTGDLGDFRRDSKDRDLRAYELADDWIDLMLWGNHDYSMINKKIAFSGYTDPHPETAKIMLDWMAMGKLRFAAQTHGFLLTHAGLHRFAMDEDYDLAGWVDALNDWTCDHQFITNIPPHRGGWDNWGGIIWRDDDEALHSGLQQIYGHSRGQTTRQYGEKGHYSYCLDIGYHHVPSLAGIWLPEERVARVDNVDE